jgi:hypothetical protein
MNAIRTSAEAGELFGALAKARLAVGRLVKGKKADAGRRGSYAYADLASAIDACASALAENGVALTQGIATEDVPSTDNAGNPITATRVHVETMLGHASGQWVACTVSGWPTMGGVQGIGSTITYLRRYSLLAMVGLSPQDDDGRHAQEVADPGWDQKRRRRQAPPQQQQAPDPVKHLQDWWFAVCGDLYRSKRLPFDVRKLPTPARHAIQLHVMGVPSLSGLSRDGAGGLLAQNVLPHPEDEEGKARLARGIIAAYEAYEDAQRGQA